MGIVDANRELEQSIEGEIARGRKRLAEVQAGILAASERGPTVAGEPEVISNDFRRRGGAGRPARGLGDLREVRATTVQTFEAEVKSRVEE